MDNLHKIFAFLKNRISNKINLHGIYLYGDYDILYNTLLNTNNIYDTLMNHIFNIATTHNLEEWEFILLGNTACELCDHMSVGIKCKLITEYSNLFIQQNTNYYIHSKLVLKIFQTNYDFIYLKDNTRYNKNIENVGTYIIRNNIRITVGRDISSEVIGLIYNNNICNKTDFDMIINCNINIVNVLYEKSANVIEFIKLLNAIICSVNIYDNFKIIYRKFAYRNIEYCNDLLNHKDYFNLFEQYHNYFDILFIPLTVVNYDFIDRIKRDNYNPVYFVYSILKYKHHFKTLCKYFKNKDLSFLKNIELAYHDMHKFTNHCINTNILSKLITLIPLKYWNETLIKHLSNYSNDLTLLSAENLKYLFNDFENNIQVFYKSKIYFLYKCYPQKFNELIADNIDTIFNNLANENVIVGNYVIENVQFLLYKFPVRVVLYLSKCKINGLKFNTTSCIRVLKNNYTKIGTQVFINFLENYLPPNTKLTNGKYLCNYLFNLCDVDLFWYLVYRNENFNLSNSLFYVFYSRKIIGLINKDKYYSRVLLSYFLNIIYTMYKINETPTRQLINLIRKLFNHIKYKIIIPYDFTELLDYMIYNKIIDLDMSLYNMIEYREDIPITKYYFKENNIETYLLRPKNNNDDEINISCRNSDNEEEYSEIGTSCWVTDY